MKAVLVDKYGGPEVLRYGDAADPAPKPGEILIRVAATSVNPIDVKRRTGEAKSFAPIKFPGILGLDASGTVEKLGQGVKGFAVGDHVFAMAEDSYAELCVVNAVAAAKIPKGLDPIDAAALPTVGTAGYQLIEKGAAVMRGETILVTGAVGNVGRVAVFAAMARGARVIAGVRKTQLEIGKEVGAHEVVALDDPAAVAKLPALDAVADTVDGATAEMFIGKVKPGGIFASVLGPPANAGKHPKVKVVPVFAEGSGTDLLVIAHAVLAGKLRVPIAATWSLSEAAKAHQALEAHSGGKVLLVV